VRINRRWLDAEKISSECPNREKNYMWVLKCKRGKARGAHQCREEGISRRGKTSRSTFTEGERFVPTISVKGDTANKRGVVSAVLSKWEKMHSNIEGWVKASYDASGNKNSAEQQRD